MFSGNACIQFCQQNFRLQKTCARYQQICLYFFRFLARALGYSCQAEQCDQYVADIEMAAKNATDFTRNIRAVFNCIRQAKLKLTMENCHFAVRQVEILGRTISPEAISPQAQKFHNFPDKLKLPKSKKALQRYLGFVNYCRSYFPKMTEKPNLFYKLTKTEVSIKIRSELKETFDTVNKAFSDAFELALKQPIPGKQLVLMTDASFKSAGYALMMKGNPDLKMAFGSKTFSSVQLKISIYSVKLFIIYIEILEFAHILWEATKPTIVLTDNKSVTRSFQTKAIQPALWNACDFVLQFNFKKAHIDNSVNSAADFLSRLELKVMEKTWLKIREDIQRTLIEVTTSSSEVADEEQFHFNQADNKDESEE